MYTKLQRNDYRPVIKPPKQSILIHLEPLEKIIECAIISPYIKNEKPISLLIVAKAESGKTVLIKQYRQNKGIVYMTDCTAYGLSRDILPKIVSGEIKTIMIPDLLTPLSKAPRTRQSFIAFLNNLIEEGVAKVATYATVWDKEVNANIITGVTDEALKDGRHDIELPVQIAEKVDPIAMKIGEQQKLYGFRALVNFRSVLKSLAYRNKSSTVTEQELNEFLELATYLNYDFNPL